MVRVRCGRSLRRVGPGQVDNVRVAERVRDFALPQAHCRVAEGVVLVRFGCFADLTGDVNEPSMAVDEVVFDADDGASSLGDGIA